MDIKPVHMPTQGETLRKNNWGHPYKLTEKGPTGSGTQYLLDCIKWLGVEKHARYQPTTNTTYCNVYAYDYCCLVDAYLPRVWWLPNAINDIKAGKNVVVKYASSIGELSANMLYRWLAEWGASFGWEKIETLDEAQEAANNGEAVVICARRHQEHLSGHISVVAPESDKVKAVRQDGKVILPVQSQAGGTCIELSTWKPWWTGKEFAELGFWRNRSSATKEYAPSFSSGAATPLRASEGEHTPNHLK